MPHTSAIEKLVDAEGVKHIRISPLDNEGSHFIITKDDFRIFNWLDEPDSVNHENEELHVVLYFNAPAVVGSVRLLRTELEQMIEYFYPGLRTVDAENPITETDDETTEDETPKTLIEDPVIYNRPETGLSQYNIPFFKFHNPNGKSAITISMTDVDYTKFDSNSDDTHHYIVVTKGQSKIRCLCTVAEQLGLEWRFRGTTHVISALESNTTRLIQESLDNPE